MNYYKVDSAILPPISTASSRMMSGGIQPNVTDSIINIRNGIDYSNYSNKISGLLLVMGKNNIEKDVLHILGQQLPRIFNQKKPYPILFLHEKEKLNFEQKVLPWRNTQCAECTEQPITLNESVGLGITRSAQQSKTLSISSFQPNIFSKIYIIGRGMAGVNELQSGNSVFTAKNVVDELENNNILQHIQDLRFTSSYSADKRKLEDFSEHSITIANRESSALRTFFFGKQQSFIERVRDELLSRGYTNIKVSGYHGNGVFYSDTPPQSHFRSVSIPATDVIKRKSVRVTYDLNNYVQSDVD